jgi:FMN phosphatase YigB (HAD superfamily)
VKLVLFDVDGTLFDDERRDNHRHALAYFTGGVVRALDAAAPPR